MLSCAGELHRNNAAKKEQELQELRRVVAAKEKSIDSLRDQLSSLKRMLEGRAQEAENQVIQKDLEVGLCTGLWAGTIQCSQRHGVLALVVRQTGAVSLRDHAQLVWAQHVGDPVIWRDLHLQRLALPLVL